LLEVRRRLEQERTAELVRARRAVADTGADLDSLLGRKEEIHASMNEVADATVGRVQSLRMIMEHVEVGIRNASLLHAAASAEVDQRVEAFRVAAVRRESLERIVSARLEFTEQVRRASEQKVQDEVALNTFRSSQRRER